LTGRPAIVLRGVVKRFGSVRALAGADLELRAGEVHGLLGQNGSGKSTLVKVLTGYHAPDNVEHAEAWGEPLSFPVRHPHERGIAVIHQDLALVDSMTVVENLGISTGYRSRAFAPVSWKGERREAVELLERLGMPLEPEAPVGSLGAAERAAVAVGRAMRELRRYTGNQMLILDEPTAYLPAEEAARVISLMRSVAADGAAVMFISHRLAEVKEVCDRVTVLRDGKRVAEVAAAETTPRAMIRMMLGRDIGDFYPPKLEHRPGGVLLSAEELRGRVVDGVSLELREGEILGVTGLVGQGQQELPYLLAAAREHGGIVRLGGEILDGAGPRGALGRGVVLVPANRQRDGLWLKASAAENISLPRMGEHVRRGVLRPASEAARSRELMERLGVRPPEPGRVVSGFSGGNQQKISLAKWLQYEPRVLILDEPTQGVDAGAKREILGLVRDTAAGGAGVVVCSSDYEEVANICHRVLVLLEGRVRAELAGDRVTEQAIIEACNLDHEREEAV
jgi:ribose transport system ATP-binding protein